MRNLKLSLVLVAALAFSIAMTGTASAESFLSTVSKAKLLSTGVQKQVFTTNAGTIECTEANIVGGETGTAGTEEKVQLAEIAYKGCLAFGFLTTVKNADYLFLPSGVAHIDSEITIEGGGCEVKIPPQLIGTVLYKNSGNNIKLEPQVEEILYTSKGCTSGNGESKNGTYTGNSEAMIAGGKLSFMALPVQAWSSLVLYWKLQIVEHPAGSKDCFEAQLMNINVLPKNADPWKLAPCP
jgi:hypothetical protein